MRRIQVLQGPRVYPIHVHSMLVAVLSLLLNLSLLLSSRLSPLRLRFGSSCRLYCLWLWLWLWLLLWLLLLLSLLPSLVMLLLLLLLLLLRLLLLLLTYRVPFRAAAMAGKNPAGAAHMDVRRSRQGQDAPSANPRHGRGPGARSAEGARQGVLSFGYFSLHEQRKVTRRQAEAFALALL
ncbi:hypothetical protein [Xanthomonas medicagonis]|uniref:hypothetical protein n=1 Tax=Xanthomonas medicagonis TaxID=3160841 RepID=UPI0035156511